MSRHGWRPETETETETERERADRRAPRFLSTVARVRALWSAIQYNGLLDLVVRHVCVSRVHKACWTAVPHSVLIPPLFQVRSLLFFLEPLGQLLDFISNHKSTTAIRYSDKLTHVIICLNNTHD
jgi:hypothetical protein